MARPAEGTEAPTPRRLAEARRLGLVAHSRALTSAAGLAAAFAVLALSARSTVAALTGYMRETLTAATGAGGLAAPVLDRALAVAVRAAAPVIGAALAGALVAGLVQTRGLFAFAPLGADLARLAPGAGRRRSGLADAMLLAEIGVVVAVAALTLAPALRALPALTGAPAPRLLAALGAVGARLAGRLVLAALALGAADYLVARRRHLRALRMTREEVKREEREREGDPRQRAERRRRHQELAEETTRSG
jgi:type III secretion protein U